MILSRFDDSSFYPNGGNAMREIRLLWFIATLVFGGCGNELSARYDAVFENMGQVATVMDAIEAKERSKDGEGRTVTGRDIVLGCLSFYDPSGATASRDVADYVAKYESFRYRFETGAGYPYISEAPQVFLTELCHLAWLEGMGMLPGGMPSPHVLEPAFWNPTLFPFAFNEWKPVIPGIGDRYDIISVDTRDSLADAWKISRKFVRPGETRRDAVIRIVRWLKAEVPLVGEGLEGRPNASQFENTLTKFTGSSSYMINAVLSLCRSIGIPVVRLLQADNQGSWYHPQLWLPEEHEFIDVRLLYRYAAIEAEKALLPMSVVANGKDASPYFLEVLGGNGSKLSGTYVTMLWQNGLWYVVLFRNGAWAFSDLVPDEISRLNKEFPRLIGTNGFQTVPRLTFAQMTDPNFALN